MSASADIIKWAFETVGANPSWSFEDINTRILEIEPSDGSVVDVGYAREIVLAIQRYVRFGGERDYNRYFMVSASTPFQALILHVLRRSYECGYRRKGDACYRRIVKNGRYVGAWTSVTTIRDFVFRETKKESQPEQFRNLTNSRENLDAACKYLTDTDHAEFPLLVENPCEIAFANGIFNFHETLFVEHDDREPLIDKCALAYVDMPFRGTSLESEHAKAALAELGSLYEQLGIHRDLHEWLYAMFGRSFFETNELDRWQVMGYIRTSESLENHALAVFHDVFAATLGADNVAHVGPGSNPTFSAEQLVHARLCFLLLRDGSTPVEQGDWQSMVSGEHVLVHWRGSKVSTPRRWTSHMLGVGSCLPYKDDAGAVNRRVLMFDASTGTAAHFDALKETMLANLDVWLLQSVATYRRVVEAHGKRDIWAEGVLPPKMLEMKELLQEMTNPLHKFLNSGVFVRDEQLFVPLSVFKDAYYEFRRKRQLQPQRWVREHYQAAFQDVHIHIERSQREYQGVKSTQDWVCGIDFVERSEHLDVTEESLSGLRLLADSLDTQLQHVQREVEISEQILEVQNHILSLRQTRLELREQLKACKLLQSERAQ